jgi:hypothetical protein
MPLLHLIAIEEDDTIYEKGKAQQLFTLHAMTVGWDSDGKRRHDSSPKVCMRYHSFQQRGIKPHLDRGAA